MKTTLKTLYLTLSLLTFIGAATTALQAQTPIPTTVPSAFDSHFIEWPSETTKDDHGDFKFLSLIRAWRGPEHTTGYNEHRGWDNHDGWFSTEARNLAYFTDFFTDESGELVLQENGQPIPIKADVYHWTKTTHHNGRVSWSASYTEVDLQSLTGKGFAWGYATDNIFSPINGATETSTSYIGDTWVVDSVGWKVTEPIVNE